MDWRCHCCYHLNTSDKRICTRCGLLGKRKIINLKEEVQDYDSPRRFPYPHDKRTPSPGEDVRRDLKDERKDSWEKRKENISPGRGVPKLGANIGGDERGREAVKFQHQGNLVSSPRTSPTHAEVDQPRPAGEYTQKRRGSQDKRKENISLARGAPMLGANAGGDERARNVSTPSAAAAKVPSSSGISSQRTPSPRRGQLGGKVDEHPRGGSQEKDDSMTTSRWRCVRCTYINPSTAFLCEICHASGPSSMNSPSPPGTAKKVEQPEVSPASSSKKYTPTTGSKSIRSETGFTCKCSKCSTNIPWGKLYCPNCTRFGDTRSSQL